jgi:hypothetical protein
MKFKKQLRKKNDKKELRAKGDNGHSTGTNHNSDTGAPRARTPKTNFNSKVAVYNY